MRLHCGAVPHHAKEVGRGLDAQNAWPVVPADIRLLASLFTGRGRAPSLGMSIDLLAGTKLLGLFAATAIAEIVGCYLPYLWLKQGKSAWLLLPAAASLALFVWLLTLHPHAAGRVYAAYGGVYVAVAVGWLWAVDSVRPTATDVLGVGICLVGMFVIMFGGRHA